MVLIFILILFVKMVEHYLYVWMPEKQLEYQKFLEAIDSVENLNEKMVKKEGVFPIPASPIYVNTVSAEILEQLGLSNAVAERWVKFRNALGRYSSLDDLEKIYGISSDWLLHFDAFMIFDKPEIDHEIKFEKSLNNTMMFDFDPNKVSVDGLDKLGFSNRTQQALIKFRENGGRFNDREDLQFLFGMTSEFYNKIADYIKIENLDKQINVTDFRANENKEQIFVDINSSDAEAWQKLRGIGPFYAKRIVNFRNHLGGFHDIDQIAETYGLPDTVFQQIRPYLRMTSSNTKIEINRVDKVTLSEHPYFSQKQASVLINFRDEHGPLQSVNDLYRVLIFDSAFVQKIKPYLAFQ